MLLSNLLTNEGFSIHLTEMALYHVTFGAIPSSDLFDGRQILTLAMQNLVVVSRPTNDRILLNTTAVEDGIAGAEAPLIVNRDISATNGIVHEVDNVLLPTFAFLNVIDVLMMRDNFQIFLELAVLTELDEPLGQATIMVLAPNDEAFQDLPGGALEAFRDPINRGFLTRIISYHLSSTVATSIQIQETSQIPTLEGSAVSVQVETQGDVVTGILFDEARGVNFNILAQNGLFHELDGVLLPPNR